MTAEGFWVFGYGSLMWNPEFAYSDRQIARLAGYHRSFCMRSIHHRGTVEAPGLVLALDKVADGFCDGFAFRVDAQNAEQTYADLRERELISSAYLETEQMLTLRDNREVKAITYVVDETHGQYCGGLALEEQAQIIAKAHGGRGPNSEYLFNTADHLIEIGLEDRELSWLAKKVRSIG